MSISISEPMRITLDALYEGHAAPAEAVAALTPAERDEVTRLVRTANLARSSLNQPIPTAEMEAAALQRAHQAMANRIATGAPASKSAPAKASPPKPITPAPIASRTEKEKEADEANWFARLFKKPK